MGKVSTKYFVRQKGKTKCRIYRHEIKRNSLGLICSLWLYCFAKTASDSNSQSLFLFLVIISRVKSFFLISLPGKRERSLTQLEKQFAATTFYCNATCSAVLQFRSHTHIPTASFYHKLCQIYLLFSLLLLHCELNIGTAQ